MMAYSFGCSLRSWNDSSTALSKASIAIWMLLMACVCCLLVGAVAVRPVMTCTRHSAAYKNNMDTDLRDDESLNSTAMALINGVSSNSHGIRESPQSKEVAHPPTAHMNSVLSLQPPPPGHKRIDNLVLDTHATVQRLLRKLLTIRSLNSWTRN